ncbi:COMM domain-containing protein 4-like [Zootermopsis nevadensis]|uniref:COMM domain-containing protein 4 n=1 Tax=Zootermopsis nevadensis TaxID=136037 RepID=A0A067RHZ0_ZOONE|nr:COMM domain-containing protein 4-like [Zootermopsis nevadensis]XP_021921138.1 COMM domain-containing protein 4-like [Zootermopsis nevadensis]KDR18862.1 COMM domain-containing protein 4 [Zootermopsis nevadensis]
MRFRFCGDLDCPDWILAEINTLARMTSVKMKLVCQHVTRSLLGEDMDFERVKKLTADAKFESGEVKASVAALLFVLATSARHGVDGETLGSELQQLGLPREHATALCRVYNDNLASISSKLRDHSLRLSHLQDVQWRLDTVVVDKNLTVGELRLSLQVMDPMSGTQCTHNFSMNAQQLHLLLADLKRASSLMEQL